MCIIIVSLTLTRRRPKGKKKLDLPETGCYGRSKIKRVSNMFSRFALINIISLILILVVGALIHNEETGAIMV